jgi:hypothetical protein
MESKGEQLVEAARAAGAVREIVPQVRQPAIKGKACAQCPWRLSNQGKRHEFGFYTAANLRRLWKQVRGGDAAQSCHLTDPSHPDHVAVGAKPGAKAQECPGSVILIRREIQVLAEMGGGVVGTKEGLARYFKERRKGLTKKGVLYWVIQRIQFGHVPFFNSDGPLPEIEDDEAIGLPEGWL